MPIQAVPNYTPPPTPPIQRGDRATFSGRVDQTITYLVGAPGEVKAMADVTYNNALIAEAAAIAASASEDAAGDSAAAALGTVPVTSTTPPPNPAENAVWIHADTLRKYTYVAVTGGYRWVEADASIVYQTGDITAQINTRLATTGARRNVTFDGPGSVAAFGRNADNSGAQYQGVQIGGGDITYGAEGTLLGNDGHASWLRFTPSKNESPLEVLLYPTAAQGIATTVSGGNVVNRISGTLFKAAWVGKKIYIGEAVYRVATVPNDSSMTVTTAGGGAVSFGSNLTETFHVAYISGSGIGNVSGNSFIRTSGDPLLPFYTLPSFVFKVNGVVQTVTASANASTYTLGGVPSPATGVPYTFELDINDQLTTFRVQKLVGGSEENLSIYARYDGYWIASQYAGSGKYRPVILSSGQVAGAEARQINMYANGDVTFGGPYGADSLRLKGRTTATVANRMEVEPAGAGFKPSLRARGTDANVGFGIDAQGTGEIVLSGGSFARNMMAFGAVVGATTHISAYANIGYATLYPAGAANGGIRIFAAGTGEVDLRGGDASPKVRVSTTGVGFFNTAPVAKPTVTGSRGGNAALASLITALAAYGLIVDNTTA